MWLQNRRSVEPNKETLLHVTAGNLGGHGRDVEWGTAFKFDAVRVTSEYLTSHAAAIPLEGYSLQCELYAREDADPAVLEFSRPIGLLGGLL